LTTGSNAYGILKPRLHTAIFFVIVNNIGQPGYMNWDQLKTLVDNNMTVGSHSLNHPVLTECSQDQLEDEFRTSKIVLENRLQTAVNNFSIPRGFVNQKIIMTVKDAGYLRLFVSGQVSVTSDFCIPRTAVKHHWGSKRMSMALRNQKPLHEHFFDWGKAVVKSVAGSQNYNKIRSKLINKPS